MASRYPRHIRSTSATASGPVPDVKSMAVTQPQAPQPQPTPPTPSSGTTEA